MDPKLKAPASAQDAPPLEPNVHEHGVDGYTDSAVGGFGEDYTFQVAHGGEDEAPGSVSDTEADTSSVEHPGSLEHAVQKALARAHIDAADLRIAAAGSCIRLRGSVRHLFEKTELESRARSVPGVTSVVSELFVLRGGWDENA
jgi:hypothetical protein